MSDQVTNILAALDFNEDLKREVDTRIMEVAEKVAIQKAEHIAEGMARMYLDLHGRSILNDLVRNTVEDLITTKIQQFKNDSSYINNHSNLIKQFATTATQEHLRNSLRHLIGAQNLY